MNEFKPHQNCDRATSHTQEDFLASRKSPQRLRCSLLTVAVFFACFAAVGGCLPDQSEPPVPLSWPRSMEFTLLGGEKEPAFSPVIHAPADTIRRDIVPVASCLGYPGFQEHGSDYRPYKPSMGYVSSAHELTCRWGASQDLSVDSTQLPRYVEAMNDTLRLAADAVAYAVRLTPTAEGPGYIPNSIYLVAEVGDSLYYRDLGEERPRNRNASNVAVRDLRFIRVPGAETQYFWLETEFHNLFHTDTTRVVTNGWRGRIFTYDESRGVRHLKGLPIRVEEFVNGEYQGMEQWDVVVPEPGIMEVSVRKREGSVHLRSLDLLGRHVIDTTATDERETRRTCCN